jgi:4-hydroxythreonine-4-phosphate dehydrogenase
MENATGMIHKPRVGLLLGDPSGIGPEVAAKLLSLPETLQRAEILVIGDGQVYRRGFEIAGSPEVAVQFLDYGSGARDYPTAKASAAAGEYTLGSLRLAIEIMQRGDLDAIVYAPLNKQAMKLAGLAHEDELHYFAALLGYSGTVSEINVCGGLWTSRVTSHVPLRAVPGLITVDKICAAALLLHGALIAGGIRSPRIAIAALNPHAGEGGLLGTEELTTIAPAVDRVRASGVDVTGPLPADTLFIAARRGDYDGVVTMYHDQGQIALKLLGFDRGVTVSGGLPVAITTPAHGTAFDIAGKGIADVGAMRAAFTIACNMATAARHAGTAHGSGK